MSGDRRPLYGFETCENMSRVPIAENYPQGNLTIGVTAEQERWRGAGAASAAGTSLQNARPGCIASPKVSASNSIYAQGKPGKFGACDLRQDRSNQSNPNKVVSCWMIRLHA